DAARRLGSLLPDRLNNFEHKRRIDHADRDRADHRIDVVLQRRRPLSRVFCTAPGATMACDVQLGALLERDKPRRFFLQGGPPCPALPDGALRLGMVEDLAALARAPPRLGERPGAHRAEPHTALAPVAPRPVPKYPRFRTAVGNTQPQPAAVA